MPLRGGDEDDDEVEVPVVGLPPGPGSIFADGNPFNLPNAFTFLRVLLVPVVLWLLLDDRPGTDWAAFAVFVFAAWTDSLDGAVARRFGTITRWGQLADPIADKLLIIGTLASLAVVGPVPWWAVVVITVREVAVTAARIRLVQRRGLVIPASMWGKAKTITQIVAISAYLAPVVPELLADGLLWLAVLATLLSGIRYGVDIGRGGGTGDDRTAGGS